MSGSSNFRPPAEDAWVHTYQTLLPQWQSLSHSRQVRFPFPSFPAFMSPLLIFVRFINFGIQQKLFFMSLFVLVYSENVLWKIKFRDFGVLGFGFW